MDAIVLGVVTRVDHGGYQVELDTADAEPVRVRCEVRGTLRRALKNDGREKVIVGDRVKLAREGDDRGVIEDLEPRRSVLGRRAVSGAPRHQLTAANLDRVAVIVAAKEPAWKPGFVDRVLCAAEQTGIAGLVVLNKIDLCSAADRRDLERDLAPYTAIGADVLFTSATTGDGVADLRRHLEGRVTVVTGPSGVGKSSLLNAMCPGLTLVTNEVSRATHKGKHTTTAVTMLRFAPRSYIVDTPGIRSFALHDLDPRELGWLFRDLRPYAYHDGDRDRTRCRFADCRHTREPGCEVRHAVESGALSRARYESYTRILDSLANERGGS